MVKVLYVATVVKTHIMEFHVPYLKMIKDMGWETAVAARNDYEVASDCKIPYCDQYFDVAFNRNPLNPKNIKAYKKLKSIIDNGDYDIIHCHTPVGALLTRLAAKAARKKGAKVFYTAHGFHFYKGAPIINWLAYYPIEKLMARKTDVLITITREDYTRAQKFHAGKVVYIPGVGIDTERFKTGSRENADLLRKEFGIPQDAKVILSVGEVNKNKNHRAVIKVMPSFPDVWYVLCGSGPLISEYKKLAEELGVSDRVILTGYRTDVVDFYKMADVFVFPSFREGLPVALMEAMSSGLICVASRNRGTNDLLPESRLLFDVNNSEELKEKISVSLSEDLDDEVCRNRKTVKSFGIDNALSMMKEFYTSNLRRK